MSRLHESILLIYKHHLNRVNYDTQKCWFQFVKDESTRGSGKLFRYISAEDKQYLSVHWTTHGDIGCSGPEEFLMQQIQFWLKKWYISNTHNHELASELLHFVKYARDNHNSSHVFDEHALDNALKGYAKETKGSDVFTPSTLRLLPVYAKRALANAVQWAINNVVVPHQWLLSLNALLGKPKGCRTVSKTPVLYRMALRSESDVRQWEIDNAQEYDTATLGNSALYAALTRNIQAEVATLLNKSYAAIFNDYDKFFDTMDVPSLLVAGINHNFPLSWMAFALQQHLAPRVLQACGHTSVSRQICNSILAGCKLSCPFTRVYVYKAMRELCKNIPMQIRRYILMTHRCLPQGQTRSK